MKQQDKMKEVVNDDINEIVMEFVPLYRDWLFSCFKGYEKDMGTAKALDATLNLCVNSLFNIMTNSSSNLLRSMKAPKALSNMLVDHIEVSFPKQIDVLREQCKDGFEEEK